MNQGADVGAGTLTVEQALQQAVAHHKAGRLQDAERLYRAILQVQPNHPDANHNLGVLAVQMNQVAAGLPHFKAALEADPAREQYWLSYAEALLATGQAVEALNVIQAEMQRGHNTPAAQSLLQKAEAAVPNDNANVKEPTPAEINQLAALFDAGRYVELESRTRELIEQYPDSGFLWTALGTFLRAQGKEALQAYQRAVELMPNDAEAHSNLGVTLKELGQLDNAVASYRRALELNPDYAEAHSNLGNALTALGQPDKAVASYRRALEIKPEYAEAHFNLGVALKDLGQFDGAVTSYRRALEIKPDYAEAHYNQGLVLQELGQLDEAVANYRRALEIKPDYAEAQCNLGLALTDLGQLDDAVSSYRRALEIKPDYVLAHDNLLFALNYHPDLSAEEIYRAYREYDTSFGIPLRSTWRLHNNDQNPDRRLRVGYVSPDFRRHACRSFLEPLLAHHDKRQVEIYAYAELVKEDEVTARYKSYVDHWITTKGMSDEALAERIRSDGIDILVDLAGHTAGNRLLTFARKPAPVSLSWGMGYGYTTGLSAIDYYLTDEVSVPIGSEGLFGEQPWRVAHPDRSYRPAGTMGEVSSLPAQERGYITYGTMTRAVRVNYRMVRVWAKILHVVPSSHLVIDSANFKDPVMQERVAARFTEHGISRERLEIGFRSPPWDTLRGIDIGLDCFPQNSGTTLFESLYMGVPYITLAGRPSVGRLGSSILRAAGHPEWIAESEDEYVAKAVELASDVVRLSEIRSALRGQMEAGPLRDEAGFARKVETAYREMFEKWARG